MRRWYRYWEEELPPLGEIVFVIIVGVLIWMVI